jgi:hypothetical protein
VAVTSRFAEGAHHRNDPCTLGWQDVRPFSDNTESLISDLHEAHRLFLRVKRSGGVEQGCPSGDAASPLSLAPQRVNGCYVFTSLWEGPPAAGRSNSQASLSVWSWPPSGLDAHLGTMHLLHCWRMLLHWAASRAVVPGLRKPASPVSFVRKQGLASIDVGHELQSRSLRTTKKATGTHLVICIVLVMRKQGDGLCRSCRVALRFRCLLPKGRVLVLPVHIPRPTLRLRRSRM